MQKFCVSEKYSTIKILFVIVMEFMYLKDFVIWDVS
jgi:hypothetical protein